MEKVKLEELKTNMLLIEAKARECVEEANFRMGATTDETVVESVRKEIYEVNNKLEKANSTNVPNSPGEIDLTDCYVITQETFDLWGLNKIKLSEDEKYLVRFNEKEINDNESKADLIVAVGTGEVPYVAIAGSILIIMIAITSSIYVIKKKRK